MKGLVFEPMIIDIPLKFSWVMAMASLTIFWDAHIPFGVLAQVLGVLLDLEGTSDL